jgi:hypothetical protein
MKAMVRTPASDAWFKRITDGKVRGPYDDENIGFCCGATEGRAFARKLETSLRDAISTYRGKDCVVTEDRIEAWEAVLKHE